MARVEAVNQTVGSLVLGLQSIPSIAWVPLGILWFGLTDTGIIFVTAIGAVFAVTINMVLISPAISNKLTYTT